MGLFLIFISFFGFGLHFARFNQCVLREQQRKTNSEYVFPSPTGGPISPDSVLKMLHRVLKRAGLPEIRFHDMRHPNVKPTTQTFSSFFENFGTALCALT